MMRYSVNTARDDAVVLQDRLNEIAQEGGRVVSVIWTPARAIHSDLAGALTGEQHSVFSGYTVVSEHAERK